MNEEKLHQSATGFTSSRGAKREGTWHKPIGRKNINFYITEEETKH